MNKIKQHNVKIVMKYIPDSKRNGLIKFFASRQARGISNVQFYTNNMLKNDYFNCYLIKARLNPRAIHHLRLHTNFLAIQSI